jgi:hypothetical protein
MPNKVAIEACIAGKLKPEEAADEDIVATVLGSCIAAAPIGEGPIPIKASVEIGIYDPPSVEVFFTRTFLEQSSPTGGLLTIESTPSACVIAK